MGLVFFKILIPGKFPKGPAQDSPDLDHENKKFLGGSHDKRTKFKRKRLWALPCISFQLCFICQNYTILSIRYIK